MTIQLACKPLPEQEEPYDLLVLPFWEEGKEAADLSLYRELVAKPLETGDFKGKFNDAQLLYGDGRVLMLGLGKESMITGEFLRRAYSSAVRTAQTKKVKTIHVLFPQISKISMHEALRGIAEGILLTNYQFAHLKNDTLRENPVVLLEKATFLGVPESDRKLLEKWRTISAGVHFVRELVNGNADDVTPEMMVQTVHSLEKRGSHLKAHILDKKQIEKEKMGLLLAVNRGSDKEPYLATLSYQGNKESDEHIVLVGKGITYDTGGLSLKTTDNMLTMKCDMSGAATVLAAVHTASALQLKVNVSAVCPLTENSIDAKSYKLGDVYRSMCGKTVEVNNTDAEGRLVLADAISYAIKYLHPTKLIDVASLTGAIVVALGEEVSGLFASDDSLADQLFLASKQTGELLWRMPLHADYKEMLKSEIADLINSAGRPASAITAALFIQEFCGSVPWAHLDIAGNCFLTKPKFYNTSKATGFGLRLLVDYLERLSLQ